MTAADAIAIPLGNGGQALVDAADLQLVAAIRWRRSNKGYATGRWPGPDGQMRSSFMHRLILGAPPGLQVDHINHDRLDNRRSNLRLATGSQNNANRRHADGKYRGVIYNRGKRKWQAYLGVRGRQLHLGYFETAEQAAAAYNDAARREFDAFATLNPRLLGTSRDW